MSSPVKVGLLLIVGIVGVVIAFKIIGTILGLLIPLAILGAIGLVVYGLVTRSNSLPGGRRYLP
jgi:hypothetical protein